MRREMRRLMAALVEVLEAVPRAKSEQGSEVLAGRGREALRTRVPSYSLPDLARGGGWCEAPIAYAGRRDIVALCAHYYGEADCYWRTHT